MPYKIYTYEDPYKLNQTDFWEEISVYPHFCSARTQVNGFKHVLGDSIKGLICPLEKLISNQKTYKKWTDNISLRIEQYSHLTSEFRRLLNQNEIDENFHLALCQNQNHFLEAIRLFIELGIPASAIDKIKGNREQQIFVDILNRLQNSDLFQFPEFPNDSELQDIIVGIAEDEYLEYKGDEKEHQRCKRAKEVSKALPLKAIVVHGVHQFSAVQLRFIISLEKIGITVIFLFNYQKKYSSIYATWKDIYSCFGSPIHHDTSITEYRIPTMQNPSNALGCAIGEILQDHYDKKIPLLQRWHKLYQDIDLIEFANIIEYAHFVSNHFDAAIKRYAESRGVMDRGNDVWDHSKILKHMDEQVYTANRDIHTLLKIYYPEYAKDRHFLLYPIGQFFTAIYRLWDYKTGQILFDNSAIKECLSSNVLRTAPGEELLRTFYNLEILMESIPDLAEFRKSITDTYRNQLKQINSTKGETIEAKLKELSIYNKYLVTEKDVQNFVDAVEEINEIARGLFLTGGKSEDYINFGMHFQKLEEFLKQRELILANELEKSLVLALQSRLDQIKPEQSTFEGTIQDLREGLHYFLKQKNDENQEVDWIVKNFEQIDGDILYSKWQFEQEENKVYHFACLSDRDMNKSLNDQLPWPLTDEFIRTSYSPVELQFQVYYTALAERSNFLRYALFYGLFYNRSHVRLSYVKQYEDEVTEPFSMISILGLTPKSGLIEEISTSTPYSIKISKIETQGMEYERVHMMDMFLCPYKYFLDYVMSDKPIIKGNVLYQKYFENLLIEAVWEKIGGWQTKRAETYLMSIINKESQKIEPYFSYWKSTEIYDLKLRAFNYLTNHIIDKKAPIIKAYDEEHMKIRKYFGPAMYTVDISDSEPKNPYSSFESLAVSENSKKVYSLYKVPKSNKDRDSKMRADKLIRDAKEYINQDNSIQKDAVPSDWCSYCTHKGNCLESFIRL